MPHQYRVEFRQRVLALLDSGAKVADIAADRDVSANTIYNWRNQHLIEPGYQGRVKRDLGDFGVEVADLERLTTVEAHIERVAQVDVVVVGRH